MAASLNTKPSDATIEKSDVGYAKSIPEKPDWPNDVERQIPGDDAVETSADKETPRDPNVVDWDGPDDPENPMNWAQKKKVAAIGIVSFITLLSPLSSTMISPATGELMKTFHSTNETLGAFVTSVYLLGYTFGPLVIAPLSEIYGRAIMYNINNVFFLIFSIACAVANSMSSLIVFRLLAGIAASCPLTLGAGTIADMVPHERRGLAMALWIMGPLIGPTVGPLAGAYLAAAKGWRWIFWLITIVGGVAATVTALFMRESYAYVILERKTKRLRKETGNPHLRSALDKRISPKELLKTSIVRPLRMLVFSPIILALSLEMATVYGYCYLMFTTFPRIFEGQYGFSDKSVGLVYIGIGVGSFCGLVFSGAFSDRLVAALTKRNGGKPKPEYRLPAMIFGSFVIPIGLFMYAWTAEEKVHWIAPIIGTALLGVGMFVIFMPGLAYLVDAYTVYAASVSAASTVLRSLLGAVLPLVGDTMYNSLGVGWGTSLLGFIATAFVPVPIILWFYGERIRNSRFSKTEF